MLVLCGYQCHTSSCIHGKSQKHPIEWAGADRLRHFLQQRLPRYVTPSPSLCSCTTLLLCLGTTTTKMMMVVMVMSILTSAIPASCSFFSYTPHFPSPCLLAFLISLYPYGNHPLPHASPGTSYPSCSNSNISIMTKVRRKFIQPPVNPFSLSWNHYFQ